MKISHIKIILVFIFLPSYVFTQSTEDIWKKSIQDSFVTKNIVYKKISDVNLQLQILYPNIERKTYPVIIFFFGGGWTNGSPEQFRQQARYFTERGFISILTDYRTQSKNNTTPFDAVRDAKSAIRYLRQHAMELQIDSGHIVASGGSAGGHLAAAADLTYLDEAGEDMTVSSRPNALILFNPVFDNGPSGYGYERIGEKYQVISPLHNIRAAAAPTIVFLGTKDVHVPVATAELYKHRMEAAGNRCDLFLYEDQKHGFFNYRPNTSNKYFFITLKEADAFLSSLGYIKPQQ